MRKIYESDRLTVVERELPRRDGGSETRAYIDHPGSVVILPLLDPSTVLLLSNHRPHIGQALWELPAGTRARGESALDAAARELIEETGYAAGSLTPLFRFVAAPGTSNEWMDVFVATDLTEVGSQPDQTERIEVHAVPLRDALHMVHRGEIVDGKTLATLLRWCAQPP